MSDLSLSVLPAAQRSEAHSTGSSLAYAAPAVLMTTSHPAVSWPLPNQPLISSSSTVF